MAILLRELVSSDEGAMNERMKLQRFSRLMVGISVAGFVLVPVYYLLRWSGLGGAAGMTPPVPHPRMLDDLVLWQRTLGWALSMLTVGGFAMYGLWRLRALFTLYTGGLYFTPDNVRCLKQFAAAVIAVGIGMIAQVPLTSLTLTMANPPGERFLMIGLNGHHLVTIFIGLVFLAIAWVMGKARALADDNAAIV